MQITEQAAKNISLSHPSTTITVKKAKLHQPFIPISGSLSRSQFPVFTLFAQKICVRLAQTLCPGLGWIFDRVQDYKMLGFARETRPAETTEDCMAQCLAEKTFICRSANFDSLKNTCELSDMDRHTVNSRNAFFVSWPLFMRKRDVDGCRCELWLSACHWDRLHGE